MRLSSARSMSRTLSCGGCEVVKSEDLRNRLDKIIPETYKYDTGLASDVRYLLGMLDTYEAGLYRVSRKQMMALISVCDELIGRWENESKAFIEYDSWVTGLAESEAS